MPTVKRNAPRSATSAWALVAYLGFLLLAAPCTCLAGPAPATDDAVCCCGPGAKTPCAPKSGSESHGDCGGTLGAGCAQALPETATVETLVIGEELPAPQPALALEFDLGAPDAVLARAARARGPALPLPRLDQVRSTVLLI
jgi:hypothetical protein